MYKIRRGSIGVKKKHSYIYIYIYIYICIYMYIPEKMYNLQLAVTYFFLRINVFFTPINSSHYFMYNSIKVRSSKNEYFTR